MNSEKERNTLIKDSETSLEFALKNQHLWNDWLKILSSEPLNRTEIDFSDTAAKAAEYHRVLSKVSKLAADEFVKNYITIRLEEQITNETLQLVIDYIEKILKDNKATITKITVG